MNIDAQARALTIQATAQSEQLALGGEMILKLYERLAPAEAHAQTALEASTEGDYIPQLEKGYNVITNTVKELRDMEK